MKKTRKAMSLLLAVCMTAALLTACGGSGGSGGSGSSGQPANNPQQSGTDSGSQGTPEYSFSMAHHHAVGSLTDAYCNDFAKLVNEKSGGRIEITVYPGAQLGTEQEAADGILLGTQEFTVVSPGSYVDNVPGFGIETLPFMARGWDELWYLFTETKLDAALNANLQAAGGRVLGWVPTGGRHMIFVDKEVTSYKDIAGLNMRCPESTIYTGMFNALGAAPTPITWSDCYTALQTKVVDGMETPIASMIDMNFAEVSKYCLLTNHMWAVMSMVCNENVYQSLPADLQAVIDEAAAEATSNNYAQQMAAEEVSRAKCEEMGIIFHELSKDEVESLPSVFDSLKADWVKGLAGRQEIYDTFMEGREAFAAQS